MKKCPKCGKLTDSKFCPECGEPLADLEEIKVCPNCGAEANTKFCPECGTEMVSSLDQMSKDYSPEPTAQDTSVDSTDSEVVSIETVPAAATAIKAKKSKRKIIIGAVAAAVVLLLLIGILGSSGDNTNDTSSTESSTETTETVEEPETTEVEEPEEPEEPEDNSSFFGEFTDEDDYDSMSYEDLARNPEKYEGKKYKGSGKVLQVLESDSEVDMRVATSEDGWEDIVYVVYSPSIVDSRILEDDQVTFYGESHGLYSYESTMGGTITIPILYVQKITRD